MESTGRHTEEPQDRSQREIRARSIHGAQDPHLGASVRQTRAGEVKPGGSEQRQREPQERGELLDASPQLQDLLSELGLREVRHIQAHHQQSAAFRDSAPWVAELVRIVDGLAMIDKALLLKPDDAGLEFAAALINADKNRAAYTQHAQRAQAGAGRDQLVARNIAMVQY